MNDRAHRLCRSGARGRAGFTLVELIAVMVVLAVISAIGGSIVRTAAESSSRTAARTELMAEASVAMERIVAMIKYTPVRAGAPATPAISYLDANEIVWENGDDLDVPSGAPTTLLLRSVRDGDAAGSTPKLLARDVSALVLTPFDESGTNLLTGLNALSTTVQTAPIHSVGVSLTLTRGGVSVTLATRVFVRSNAETTTP
jgi:prepilin-type N-terminal cleavage/methylation domain-containing protein